MSGSSGPSARLQTPESSRVIANGLGSPSNWSVTSLAPGSSRRKVTLPSDWISGDITGGACCCARAHDTKRRTIRYVHFVARGIVHGGSRQSPDSWPGFERAQLQL